MAKTVFEPFRIKSVEPLPLPTAARRLEHIRAADYNLFRLPADAVTFDFLTDSGTSAMSAAQWAGIMIGDESYAGSKSFEHFESAVRDLTGLEYVIPTHQGRAAEALLCKALVRPGMTVPGNTHFDTTRANIEEAGARALDLPCPESADSTVDAPFKGNIDLSRLSEAVKAGAGKIPFVVMTITNNSVGGQPVSLANIKSVKEILGPLGIPLVIDAARFAENAFFIQSREPGQKEKSIPEIAREVFADADIVVMSAKKDAFANIGGFIAVKDPKLAEILRSLMVITEGFPTYGGLAGRDLEALAIGLREVVDQNYLNYRIRSVEYFARGLKSAGFTIVSPPGGHAVYIDAGQTLPHIPASQYPGQALAVALYEEVGLRGVEVGSVMLGTRNPETGEEIPAPKELVRLAMPRRVYTQSHCDYIIEIAGAMTGRLAELRGYEITYQPRALRHFTAKFRPI